jgi:predicted DNA-binding WGR domain protein
MQTSTRSFTLMDGQNKRIWSISQNLNQLMISQGLSGSPLSEIAQDFESQESAKLAMLELISEKVKAGYVEDKLTVDLSVSQNSRRLPAPEHTTAQPTHLIRAKTFAVTTDNSWEGPWEITVAWLDNTFEGSQQIVVKLFGRRRISIDSEDLGFSPFRFVSSYSSLKQIQDAYSKITDISSLQNHIASSDEVYLLKKKTKASQAVSAEIQLKLATLATSKSIKKVDIKEFDFDNISPERFNKVATAAHEYLKAKSISEHDDDFKKLIKKFTIPAIRKLADMVSAGSIEDNWESARGFDGEINFGQVSAESALLYAFAATENHGYGYWTYAKQIVKALESSGKHMQILGMFYASFDSNAAKDYHYPLSLGDSVSQWELFGSDKPSKATYRYMQRRARRHLDDLLMQDSENHALLTMIVLSHTSYSHYYKSVDDKAWIFAHLAYRTSWKDGNHGRKIYLPENQALENNLYVGAEITSRLGARQQWLSHVFSTSNCMPVVVFAFQILSRTDENVQIEKNIDRINFLLKSKNFEMLAAIQNVFDSDLDFLVDNFRYNTQYLVEYSSRSNEILTKLLNALMAKNEWWSRSSAAAILDNLCKSDLDQFRKTLVELMKHPKWSKDFLYPSSVITLLISNYDETLSLLGDEVLSMVNGQYMAHSWLEALNSMSVEAVSNEQLENIIPLIKPSLGTNLELVNGLYAASTSPGLRVLIRQIAEKNEFGNLARLLVAYTRELKSADATMHVGAALSSLIKSESDLILALKWAHEFGVREVFLDLAKVEFSIVPWQSAIKKRICDYLNTETIIPQSLLNNLSLDYLVSLALALEASEFFENVSRVDAYRTNVISSLSSELLRSDDPIMPTFILGCYEDLTSLARSNMQILFDLSASQSMDVQAMGLRMITELKLEPKTWIRLLESQLPLATIYAKEYVATLSGADFDNAVLVCLDSAVTSAREVGLSLLEDNSSRMDIDTLYVKLAESTDPHLAALVAARALEPGISDSRAIDNFDRRVLKTIRQSRRAKELVKARRLNGVVSGEQVSEEIDSLITDLAAYGNEQDSDWAIEMKSFISSVSTSADALKLSGKDN